MNMMKEKSRNHARNFQKGNALYRQGAYEQAASHYIKALGRRRGFAPIYVNLALAVRKLEDQSVCDRLLREALAAVRPGKLEEDLELVKKSRLVNGKWYRVEHEDWLPGNVDPLLHYLAVGWRLGLDPCRRFDNDYYLSAYKESMEPGEVPLLHYLYKGEAEGNKIQDQQVSSTANLAVQLWGGHSVSAIKALEAVYSDSSATKASRWWAIWHVARWKYFCGDMEQAYSLARKMRALSSATKERKETVYLEYFCLLMMGEGKEAYSTLKKFVDAHPDDADAHLALANSLDNDARRVELINQAFSIQEFGGIRRKDETRPLSIGNIEGLPAKKISGDKKVSIIMPIYNAAEQIHIAIESLLAQTYKNIEIIAVDDCSPDNTFKVLKAIEKKDSRVKAVRPPENGGAYAARNYGLKFATGDLLTTHDSDDWSHPQKIAAQVEYLEEHPEVMGCSAHWIRAQENLAFTQNWRPNNCLTHWSQSSFMFRRKVLETIGEWDHVRIGGDTEYIWRMQSQFGKQSFAKIHPEIPLAFALDEESSLTRTKATHVRTVYFGLRHIYREICAWWHASQKHLNVKGAKERRPFPAPRSMFERTDDPLVFDTVIAGDFSRLSDCQKAADFIEKQPKKKVALFYWPSFHKAPESLCNLYFELLEQGKVEPVVMGQKVTADHYKVTEKELVEYPLDGYPEFSGLKGWGLCE